VRPTSIGTWWIGQSGFGFGGGPFLFRLRFGRGSTSGETGDDPDVRKTSVGSKVFMMNNTNSYCTKVQYLIIQNHFGLRFKDRNFLRLQDLWFFEPKWTDRP